MCNCRKISNTAIVDAFELFEAQQTIESMRLTRFSDIGELAARIAHDMRNPLSVIKATLEVLQKIILPWNHTMTNSKELTGQ